MKSHDDRVSAMLRPLGISPEKRNLHIVLGIAAADSGDAESILRLSR